MPERYDNPRDIAQLMHQTKRLQQSAERSPFTGLVTLFCYVLWKDYRYSQKKLAEFCEQIHKYEDQWHDKPIDQIHDRLDDYAGWCVEYEEYTEKDFPHFRSKVAQKAIKEQIRCNNKINDLSTRYMTYGFCVLMDDGFGRRKLTNLKDKVQKQMNDVTKAGKEKGIMDLWRELIDGAGIYIEKPLFD